MSSGGRRGAYGGPEYFDEIDVDPVSAHIGGTRGVSWFGQIRGLTFWDLIDTL